MPGHDLLNHTTAIGQSSEFHLITYTDHVAGNTAALQSAPQYTRHELSSGFDRVKAGLITNDNSLQKISAHGTGVSFVSRVGVRVM